MRMEGTIKSGFVKGILNAACIALLIACGMIMATGAAFADSPDPVKPEGGWKQREPVQDHIC